MEKKITESYNLNFKLPAMFDISVSQWVQALEAIASVEMPAVNHKMFGIF